MTAVVTMCSATGVLAAGGNDFLDQLQLGRLDVNIAESPALMPYFYWSSVPGYERWRQVRALTCSPICTYLLNLRYTTVRLLASLHVSSSLAAADREGWLMIGTCCLTVVATCHGHRGAPAFASTIWTSTCMKHESLRGCFSQQVCASLICIHTFSPRKLHVTGCR